MGDSTEATDKDTLRQEVRRAYAGRAKSEGSCCGPTDGAAAHEQAALRMGYSKEDVESVPEGANLGLGSGAPLHLADLQPGEVVLDLGSGAGLDAFLAAREVGPGGRLVVSDIVLTQELPAEIGASIAAYVGCVGGASLIEDYLGAVHDAGFHDVEVVGLRSAMNVLSFGDPLVQVVMEEVGDTSSWDLEDLAGRIVSAKVVARKPETS